MPRSKAPPHTHTFRAGTPETCSRGCLDPLVRRLVEREAAEHVNDLGLQRGVGAVRHQLAHFLGDEEEIIDDMFRLAKEPLAQNRILCRNADRTCVQMTLAHHDAAGGDQRRRREAELIRAEQRADDHVAAGAQPAVNLHRDARAQIVQHERLMRLGQAEFPRQTGMLQRGLR